MSGCGELVGLTLFACLARDPACLPVEHRGHLDVLRAIAERESGFRPYALRDEAMGESRFYVTRDEAIREATRRDALGHPLGLGMFQITFRSNWARHFAPAVGPRVADQIGRAYEPCANMAAAAAHFAADWERAGVALQYYNSNKPSGAPGYAAGVLGRLPALRLAERGLPTPADLVAPSPAVAPAPPPCAPAWDAWALEACERRARRRAAAPKGEASPPSVPARGGAGKVASNAPARGTIQR